MRRRHGVGGLVFVSRSIQQLVLYSKNKVVVITIPSQSEKRCYFALFLAILNPEYSVSRALSAMRVGSDSEVDRKKEPDALQRKRLTRKTTNKKCIRK